MEVNAVRCTCKVSNVLEESVSSDEVDRFFEVSLNSRSYCCCRSLEEVGACNYAGDQARREYSCVMEGPGQQECSCVEVGLGQQECSSAVEAEDLVECSCAALVPDPMLVVGEERLHCAFAEVVPNQPCLCWEEVVRPRDAELPIAVTLVHQLGEARCLIAVGLVSRLAGRRRAKRLVTH
jgi:hypothetical protein